MPGSPDEQAWIERKAAEFADQSGYVDPMAIALAEAEFERLQALPKAPVVQITSGSDPKSARNEQ